MDENVCPTCGVVKAWDSELEGYKFWTYWARLGNAKPMSPAAFNTKCCQYVKSRGKTCINNDEGYDVRYDFKVQSENLKYNLDQIEQDLKDRGEL